jgi:hypothetical protein
MVEQCTENHLQSLTTSSRPICKHPYHTSHLYALLLVSHPVTIRYRSEPTHHCSISCIKSSTRTLTNIPITAYSRAPICVAITAAEIYVEGVSFSCRGKVTQPLLTSCGPFSLPIQPSSCILLRQHQYNMEIVSQPVLLVFIFSGMGLCSLAILIYMAFLMYQRRRNKHIIADEKRRSTHPDAWRTHVRDVFPEYEA